ncbi:MAG: T9SS type A sorting domain-containing protein [Ferruginibacter sp.]
MKTILLIFFTIIQLISYSQAPVPLPGFGTNGKVTTAFPPAIDAAAECMVVQPDHKILLAGNSFLTTYDIAVARYNPDGTLDDSFDGDGRLIIGLEATSHEDAFGMALQTDGKIVLVGYTSINSSTSGYDLLIVRLNPDGSMDNSFDGDGMVITDFNGGAQIGTSVVIQPDGKIVVDGHHRNNGSVKNDFFIARYNSDGSPDISFNGDGKRITDFNGENDFDEEMVMQDDGKFLIGGWSSNGIKNQFAIARYNSDGTLDDSFDGDGMLTTDLGVTDDKGRAIVVQANGDIVVAGQATVGSDVVFALARYKQDGSLDNSFNGNGKVITPVAGYTFNSIQHLVIQNDGKIIAVGGVDDNVANRNCVLLRYTSAGVLDNSFGVNGVAYADFGIGYEGLYDVKLVGDTIYAAGNSEANNPGANYDFAFAAFLNDPQIVALSSISFTAKNEDEKVKLQWQTNAEENTTEFMIERHEGDGNFKTIGQVHAAGNSDVLKNYSFNDTKPAQGINYYRLKLYNTNGKFNYSKTLTVEINKTGISVFPNPVDDILYIQTQHMNRSANISFVDANGKILRSQSITTNAAGIFKLSVKELSAGNYFIHIVIDGNKKTIPFIKQ